MSRETSSGGEAASASGVGPHGRLATESGAERFAAELFDRLWFEYRNRVAAVRTYEALIEAAGGAFVNDHVALRTFACQEPFVGIATLGRIFEALGYVTAGCYQFPDKHLAAVHLRHPAGRLPKVFLSELQTWRLPEEARRIVLRSVASHRMAISDESLGRVANCDRLSEVERAALLERVAREFLDRPWNLPDRADVERLDAVSQYGAWVLVHGYQVNHFTTLVNSQGAAGWESIESTAAALAAAGVSMKPQIEGAPGSKLRQTATAAATVEVEVNEQGRRVSIPWSYAYFELAERGSTIDPQTGRSVPFDGFLGDQATQLFEMTRRS